MLLGTGKLTRPASKQLTIEGLQRNRVVVNLSSHALFTQLLHHLRAGLPESVEVDPQAEDVPCRCVERVFAR